MLRTNFESIPQVSNPIDLNTEWQKQLNKQINSQNATFQNQLKKQQDNIVKSLGGVSGKTGANMTSGIVTGLNIGSGILDSAGSLFGNKGTNRETSDSIRSGIEDMAMSSGIPALQIAAAASKVLNGVNEVAGLQTNIMSDADANLLGVNNTGSKIASAIPIVGSILDWFGKDTRKYAVNSDVALSGSGYTGFSSYANAAARNAGKRSSFWDADNINSAINYADSKDDIIGRTAYTSSLWKNNGASQYISNRTLRELISPGQTVISSKSGGKFIELSEVKKIKYHKKGGVVGIDSNILPEGALHAHKNHLDKVNSDLEDATKKGIPVMAEEQGGELIQTAEIEREEIIFRLEVTKKLEELMKDGSEDAMIEAGKLLTKEIILNTTDNTGQINGDDTSKDSK